MASSNGKSQKIDQGNLRLDRVMVDQGLVPTRSKAQALVMAGQVFVNGVKITKAGTLVNGDAKIEVQGSAHRYVSRGGLKLEAGLKHFGLDPQGWRIIDIGASTGGFTDCWLQHGASHVWAVDVGYGQLDWKLRNDDRVTVLEKTNARWLSAEMLGIRELADAASIDASFISMELLLSPLRALLKEEGWVIGLVKPQFEAGPEHVGKHGVVRDRQVHVDVLRRFMAYAQKLGFSVMGLTPSPIRGPEGNIEFLSLLSNRQPVTTTHSIDIIQVVDQAWDREEPH
ncbi:TlyA family RNA methyltransferase [Sulfobacillus thermosulfidooxidans]|uniref:TlyA family RNA methyltransferase n=1 Tax=Sulfobacillus thermosulfidooxidans TaxID=28034 RepID=UPI0003FCC69B|nr:TlyA family RNA methyltransferase [Sulfobacillus thermosulfidooxidans]